MSIFYSRGTPPHSPVDIMNLKPLSQPTLSVSWLTRPVRTRTRAPCNLRGQLGPGVLSRTTRRCCKMEPESSRRLQTSGRKVNVPGKVEGFGLKSTWREKWKRWGQSQPGEQSGGVGAKVNLASKVALWTEVFEGLPRAVDFSVLGFGFEI